jgi:5-methylcytosine-specific restriction endonuclease McrA
LNRFANLAILHDDEAHRVSRTRHRGIDDPLRRSVPVEWINPLRDSPYAFGFVRQPRVRSGLASHERGPIERQARMTRHSLTHRPESKTVTDLINLYKDGLLNLEPGFQRQSVWTERDRAKLIDSMLRNYPLPAVFLYRREADGHIYYDVIDGKQRIESILMFVGQMRGRFGLKTQLPNGDQTEWIDWKRLQRKRLQHLVSGYRIPVIEVDGDIGDIIDVFVRINSTGKALTPQEKRHAKYYNSRFLREADRLARRFEEYFRSHGVLGAGQMARMKHVEFMCELMLSVHQGDVINRKAALDRVMSADGFTDNQTRKSASRATAALNRLGRMFPRIKTTRLRQMTDFYSLAVLISKLDAEGMILTDHRRNRLAWDLLSTFSATVDHVRESQRKAIGIKPHQETARDYLLSVSQMSDDVNQRRKREIILRNLIGSLFAKKDAQRGFSVEQRRILWNTAAQRRCEACSRVLTWGDFTIDHIDPHSKGGRTKLENAALMCGPCNSKKGNKRRR